IDWAVVVPVRALRKAAHGCAAAASQPGVSTDACAALPRPCKRPACCAGRTAKRADRAEEQPRVRDDSCRRLDPQARSMLAGGRTSYDWRSAKEKGGREAAPSMSSLRRPYNSGTISSATMLMILISGLI